MDAPVRLAPEGVERFPEGLLIERDGGVMTLTIEREHDMNRLMPEVLARLGWIAEALRDDENFAHVAAWEFTGVGTPPVLHREKLQFEYAHPTQRSYK